MCSIYLIAVKAHFLCVKFDELQQLSVQIGKGVWVRPPGSRCNG